MYAATRKSAAFSDRVTATRPDRIFMVRGRDVSGRAAWYYVAVDGNKRIAFKAYNGAMSVKLSDYGEILYSGFGKNPPSDIKEIMKKEYGFKESA